MSPSARIAIGVVLFLLVIGALWMVWQRPDPPPAPAKGDPVNAGRQTGNALRRDG
jgi:hypothetical protein